MDRMDDNNKSDRNDKIENSELQHINIWNHNRFCIIGLGGFMACLATLQSTVEKPKEIEESSDDDSLDGKKTFISFIVFSI